MDRYHREQRHMENGLAYHFVIGNGRGMRDGQIVVGRRWTQQLNGGHLASEALNARSIGICLVGNFDKDRPTQRQLETLDALTEYLMKRCGIPKSGVKTHQQINTVGTRCPGRLFDDGAFLRGLN
jgi:N-acetyl-anhydromuramyl-L-alanine amidase AmpD